MYVVSLAALVFVLVVGDERVRLAPLDRRSAARRCSRPRSRRSRTVIMLAKYFSDNEENIELAARLPHVAGHRRACRPCSCSSSRTSARRMVFGAIWLGMVRHRRRAAAAHRRPRSSSPAASRRLLLCQFAHGYQRERIEVWLDPESDPTGAGFNILQAEISIGSGGLLGQGVHARHADAARLPAHADDRLHLQRRRRGAGLRRRDGAVRALRRRCSSAACASPASPTTCSAA